MLSVQSHGSGVPLVFLHAFPLSQRMWEPNRPAFTKHFRFITVDLPGFGASPLTSDTSRMADMAAGVLEALDSIKLTEKFVLGGLSMGGYVLLQVLRLAPTRIRAAALFSTRSVADSPEAREKRFKTIEFVQKEGVLPFAGKQVQTLLGKSTQVENKPVVDHVKSLVEQANPNGICAALRGMAERPDTTEVLLSAKIPKLFVAGQEDVVIPPTEMEDLAKKNANSDFRILPKAGHLINLEQPALFNDTFLHFLKRRVL